MSEEDLSCLVRLILDGAESVWCMHPEHVVLLADLVARRLSIDIADSIISLYVSGNPCLKEPDPG